ncbi:MAG: HAMP domain-containing sensor histidine kinase [Prevotella sp.]|nr:HAMP domain-containing sensor histidine kinase [Prevotella sp.]
MTIALALISILLLILYISLWRRYHRNIRKVAFLFDALDSGDYSFRFPEDKGLQDDRLLNAALNRVKEILQHARDEQKEREKYYELILNSVDTGILVVDEERGIVLQHNSSALKLLGREAVSHVSQIKEQLKEFSIRESHAVLKDRRVRILGFSNIKGELANQEIDSWVKLIRVLTHEIMNSVTPIISLSDTLLNHAEGEQHEGLQVISHTGKELIAFVENYRKFTAVPVPQPALFYVRPFIERMEQLVRQTMPAAATTSVRVEPADLLVYADEALIARVVTNLLKNACQAIPDDGHVDIHAYANEQEQVIIDVTNDGPPIPEDVAAHIFVPLFTTKKDGSGIGLSISRQIMRLSGGSINLVSTPGTAPTTFQLTFN